MNEILFAVWLMGVNLPGDILTEGFEGSWTPSGWTYDGGWMKSDSARTGTGCAYLWAGQIRDDTLITPVINLAGSTQATLEFYQWSCGGQDPSKMTAILFSSDGGTTWNSIDTLFWGPKAAGYQFYAVNIPSPYWTSNFRIAFRGKVSLAMSSCFFRLDDFRVYGTIVGVDEEEYVSLPTPLRVTTSTRFLSGRVHLTVNTNSPIERLSLYAVNGSRVFHHPSPLSAGTHFFSFDGPVGLYILHATSRGRLISLPVQIVPTVKRIQVDGE